MDGKKILYALNNVLSMMTHFGYDTTIKFTETLKFMRAEDFQICVALTLLREIFLSAKPYFRLFCVALGK